jgi:putative transcriptional regulator
MRRSLALLLSGLLTLSAQGGADEPVAVKLKGPALEPSGPAIPTQGMLLVASPGMADPRFKEAVVLLLEHGREGTLGVIINRATKLTLARVLPDLDVPGKDRHKLFFGGPVGLNMLLFLIRSEDPPGGAENVVTDVYYSADRATLEGLLARRAGVDTLRLYVGHSGWAPGQLATEIAHGDWSLVPGDAPILFEKDIETIWPDLMDRLWPPGMFIEVSPSRAFTVSSVEEPAPGARDGAGAATAP